MELSLRVVSAIVMSLLFCIGIVAAAFGPLRDGGIVTPRYDCADTDEYTWCEVVQDFMSIVSLYLGVATFPIIKIMKRKWDKMEELANKAQETGQELEEVEEELSEDESEDEELAAATETMKLLTSVG
eukprot:TRINITY_DN3825_c0_g1_i1.p2 TRINITY_DN3825_c0_g1~~TRINITY_DN3825_c0_g1_i1.p2  ORF type:complete len:128 (+),score=43.54 TRINITY_DN3825_c0_g1_i1:178-561(+)